MIVGGEIMERIGTHRNLLTLPGTYKHNLRELKKNRMSSNIRIKKICKHCDKVFTAKTTVTKFCSDVCAKANYKKRIKEQKIDLSRNDTMRQLVPAIDNQGGINNPVKQSKEIITLLELSAITGLSRSTFYRLMKDKKFPRLKVGERLLFKKVQVLNYITDKYGNV